jgi:hypothetical protein
MSPVCVQYEMLDGEGHLPATQLWLQQSAAEVQALPAVLQVLSGLHAPITHCVLQQAAPPAVHA